MRYPVLYFAVCRFKRLPADHKALKLVDICLTVFMFSTFGWVALYTKTAYNCRNFEFCSDSPFHNH